jgi:peptidyl-prolyl cis-trans isomerase C
MKAANLLAVVIVAGVSAGIGYYVGEGDMISSVMKADEASVATTETGSTAPAADDAVFATVNGREIRASDLQLIYAALPAQYKQVPFEMLKSQLVTQAVNMALVQEAAEAEGLATSAEVKEKLALASDQIMQEVYLQQKIDAALTDAAVQAEYEKRIADFTPAQEIQARHILLEKEEEARDVVAKLEEGGDFVELAKEFSIGPSAENGGDLGFFQDGQMVKPFSEAAFALEKGTYTKEPVQTQFGWHVILLEDSRDTQPPALDTVRADIENSLSGAAVNGLIEGLRAKATIDIVGAEEAEGETPKAEEGNAEKQ